MADEADSWVETLGVTWFKTTEDAASSAASGDGGNNESIVDSVQSAAEGAVTSLTESASDAGIGSALEAAADAVTGDSDGDVEDPNVLAGEQLAPPNIVADSDTDGSTLIVDPPIGVLQLRSSSQADATGRVFNVTVVSSAKDVLLFGASVTGTSIGTVKISQPGGTTTLQNVQVVSIASVRGELNMTLESVPPKKKRAGAPSRPVLIVAAPIGTLDVLSFSPVDKARRVFDVTVPNTPQVALLLVAASTGKSLGTVQISTPDILITLRDVQISSIRIGGDDSTAQMRLDSSSPAEISE
jgi:hypothetical protein